MLFICFNVVNSRKLLNSYTLQLVLSQTFYIHYNILWKYVEVCFKSCSDHTIKSTINFGIYYAFYLFFFTWEGAINLEVLIVAKPMVPKVQLRTLNYCKMYKAID